ncbi:arginine--tRNA ligase, partial [bacterium]
MKAGIKEIITKAVSIAFESGLLTNASGGELPEVIIDKSKKEAFGDFSTNIAMLLSPLTKEAPRKAAGVIAELAQKDPAVEKCEVAGPGFINIFLEKTYWAETLAEILKKGSDYGKSNTGKGKKVLLEFVSANPTGPLHIGHGRGAAVGDSLARIMSLAGFEITKEFYVNDIGVQTIILGDSVRLRYKELKGEAINFPDNYYKGDYIKGLAKEIINNNVADDKDNFREFACKKMRENIEADLNRFGIIFDKWFSEGEMVRNIGGGLKSIIKKLEKRGVVFKEDNALWFKTLDYGDDKNRVLQKANGETTYFLSDVAYHLDKINRGYDMFINIWGADHHGYEARIRAVFKAFDYDDSMLKIVFIQLVALLRNGTPVAMGKREGEFVTLQQVMEEVGADACRFFFLMRKSDAHLDFDLELAKKQAPENPVYYVQYCHARIKSILFFAEEKGVKPPDVFNPALLSKLGAKEEVEIIRHLALFEETVEKSALAMEPHRITFYLTELAGLFHP